MPLRHLRMFQEARQTSILEYFNHRVDCTDLRPKFYAQTHTLFLDYRGFSQQITISLYTQQIINLTKSLNYLFIY